MLSLLLIVFFVVGLKTRRTLLSVEYNTPPTHLSLTIYPPPCTEYYITNSCITYSPNSVYMLIWTTIIGKRPTIHTITPRLPIYQLPYTSSFATTTNYSYHQIYYCLFHRFTPTHSLIHQNPTTNYSESPMGVLTGLRPLSFSFFNSIVSFFPLIQWLLYFFFPRSLIHSFQRSLTSSLFLFPFSHSVASLTSYSFLAYSLNHLLLFVCLSPHRLHQLCLFLFLTVHSRPPFLFFPR